MKILRRLFPFIRPYIPRITVATLLSIILSTLSTISIAIIWPILQVIFPSSTAPVSSTTPSVPAAPETVSSLKGSFIHLVNSIVIVPNNKLASLANLCILIIGIFLLKNVAKVAGNLITTTIDEGIIKDVRDAMFGRLMNQSMDFFNARRSGDLISVMTNDIGAMNVMITPTLNTLTREPLQAILITSLLISFSPTLTLIAASTGIVTLILIRLLTRYLKRYSGRLQVSLSEITSRMMESFQNIRIIKGYASESYEHKRFANETAWYKRSYFKFSAVSNLFSPVTEIFAIAALAAVLYYGGNQVIQHKLGADELMTFILLLFSVMQPVSTIVSIPANLQRGIIAAERVFAVYDSVPTVKSGTQTIREMHNSLELKNIRFSYRPEREVVKGISLKIERGQTIALVGTSGGGKSTLIDLMVRFYDPSEGIVTLDGTDIRQFTLESYRSMFGIVTQESILFNDTVRNNIAYNLPDLSDELVCAAAVAANAHEFIQRMPEGYNTKIGDRGVLLSGGQRQRLAIARALARDPQILLFDEATSALDSESELAVQEAIDRLLEGRTAVVIAHRLSTIRKAHRIIVVENGLITEEGTHDELLSLEGTYRKLHDMQFRENR